ncbi:MAG: phosphotransferase, partial [Candidatus Omnitrophota bacterium]|nr:phosphotransferase [Candidatus Omnitrophota bacterium]
RACHFFSIGKLRYYKKEGGGDFIHTNPLIFVVTSQGKHTLKFYPLDAAKQIVIESAVNRYLINQRFPTPAMHMGHDGQPFWASNGRLAACYSYVDGFPVWERIGQRNVVRKINTALLSLKNFLSRAEHIPFKKEENLTTLIKKLANSSCALAPYDQKEMIDAFLLCAGQTYQYHGLLFTRQRLHNDANLTNFLVHKKTIYALDLSHVREDYALADLASLVLSCIYFGAPLTMVKIAAKDYFTQHKIAHKFSPVLNTLVRIGLIDNYIGKIEREKSMDLPAYPPDLRRTHISQLLARKKIIIAVLKKMRDNPRFLV